MWAGEGGREGGREGESKRLGEAPRPASTNTHTPPARPAVSALQKRASGHEVAVATFFKTDRFRLCDAAHRSRTLVTTFEWVAEADACLSAERLAVVNCHLEGHHLKEEKRLLQLSSAVNSVQVRAPLHLLPWNFSLLASAPYAPHRLARPHPYPALPCPASPLPPLPPRTRSRRGCWSLATLMRPRPA